jgi:GxxExxY protein
MNENEIAQQIVDAALRVHMALGPGLLESVYQAAMEYELKSGDCTSLPSKPSQ